MNSTKQIAQIYRGFREAVETVYINERKYKDKLIAMYSLCASCISKEYLSLIPNDAQEAYKFLINFRKRQIKYRDMRDNKYPECRKLNINHTAFFHSLGSTASKAIQSIYKVYFVLQSEIYTAKDEYIMFI